MKKENMEKTGATQKEARRKVLRNTLIGGAVISSGALPEKWRKPALEAVILPSHAATTDSTDSGAGGNTTAAPTTTVAQTTPPTSTTPFSNVRTNFSFSSWTDPVV